MLIRVTEKVKNKCLSQLLTYFATYFKMIQIYEPIVISEKDLLCGNKDISDENNKELLLAVSK